MVKRIAVVGALLLVSGCTGNPGTAVPIAPAAPVTSTVTVAPPQTVVVPPPVTVTQQAPAAQAKPPRDRTACQWMHSNGYSYTAAYNAWLAAGYPLNWDADRDGWPCEQTFGDRN